MIGEFFIPSSQRKGPQAEIVGTQVRMCLCQRMARYDGGFLIPSTGRNGLGTDYSETKARKLFKPVIWEAGKSFQSIVYPYSSHFQLSLVAYFLPYQHLLNRS